MDFRFTPEQEAFRQGVRAFLEAELPSDWGGRNDREDNRHHYSKYPLVD